MPLAEVEILRKESQVDGSFNNGEILEKKPIGFPQDGGVSKPYSNIFYWAHAWTPTKKVQLAFILIRGLKYVVSYYLEV